MAGLLLATKLYIPPARPNLVPRPRLIERLRAGARTKLTLISAPAGFGKTTLLSEWIRQCQHPVAWLSLDNSDSDLPRFLSYCIAALRTVQADLASDVLDRLRSQHLPPIESLLAPIINDIANTPRRFALVLDDYHHIDGESVHAALTFLIDHLPPQLQLVIATRADPPLPIARLRGRDELIEMRAGDLVFTPEEIAAFLNGAMRLGLSDADVTALATRTEGWITGLQMAALSLQGRRDASTFIQAFTGSHQYVLDYLIEEVLQRQPKAIQEFLLTTSILERLTAPLCDAVTGQPGSREMLQLLDRENLFLVPLDDERRWYRYHRLFSDLLNQRLRQLQPERLTQLHRRASEWSEHNGSIEDAIRHALAAGDFDRAADLIEQAAEATLMRSEVTIFLKWMNQLPPEELRGRSDLNVFHAWALLWNGAPLHRIEQCLDIAAEDDRSEGKVASLRGFLALLKGQLTRAAAFSRQALAQLPEDDGLLRSLATVIDASLILVEGDSAAGIQILEETARLSERAGNVTVAVLMLCNLGELRHKQGRLHQAETFYRRALDLATDAQGRRLPIAGKALIGLGDLALQWNDIQTAERLLREGIELSGHWSLMGAFDGHVSLAVLLNARGDVAGAREAIRVLQELARRYDATEVDDYAVDMLDARFQIAHGDLAAARRWAKKYDLDGDLSAVLADRAEDAFTARLRKYEYLVLARLWLAEGRFDDAGALLEHVASLAGKADRPILLIETKILQAQVFQAMHQREQALSALNDALALAEPEGVMRIFLDEGEPIAKLLAQVTGEHESYAQELLAAPGGTAVEGRGVEQPSIAASALFEPLSPRELEVLRLLASGLSNQEIAHALVLAVATVKKHLKNIYGKLDVHSRTEALVRARELDLL